MKKITLLLSIILCIVAAYGIAFAAKSGDYEYEVNGDGTATITKYLGSDYKIVIPSELDGHTVTKLGNDSELFEEYMGQHRLSSITIPDSILDVSYKPFYYCDKLTSLVVSPNHPTLATIDGVLFSKQERKLVYYPQGRNTEKYDIPQGIQIIGQCAFSNSVKLKDIAIPDSVISIEDSAFSFCTNLAKIAAHG